MFEAFELGQSLPYSYLETQFSVLFVINYSICAEVPCSMNKQVPHDYEISISQDL